ncbi:MAG: ribonuclease P protein component [Fimbriimonadaceae bacterium]|nr:ribonuclease P protein component [Fimbriimonadaceae bacterium]
MFDHGLRVSGPLLTINLLPGSGLVGVATSRSIGCHARRNRNRRRVREAVRLTTSQDPAFDMALVAKSTVDGCDFQALRDEVVRLTAEAKRRWAASSAS